MATSTLPSFSPRLPEYTFRYEFEWDDISPEIEKMYGLFLDNFDVDQHILITAEYNPGEKPRFDGHPDRRHPGEDDEVDSIEFNLHVNLDSYIVTSVLTGEPLFAPDVAIDMASRVMRGEYSVRYVKARDDSVPEEYIGADFTCQGMLQFLGGAVMKWIDKNEKHLYAHTLEQCRELHAEAIAAAQVDAVEPLGRELSFSLDPEPGLGNTH